MNERQIQDGLCAYLRKNKLSHVRNRMDKKSYIREGWPDITVVHCGRAWLCELKTPTGKLSPKQKEVIAELQANGTPVTVARSVGEAIGSLEAWMGKEHAGEAYSAEKQHSRKEGDATCPHPIQQGISSSAPKSNPDSAAQNLFIAKFGLNDYVFSQGSAKLGAAATLVRQATAADLINLPRL